MPPPLPPRAAHRPLHRSNALPSSAPELPKRHQRHPTPLHPEDCFGFEIVDVDEASNLKVKIVEIVEIVKFCYCIQFDVIASRLHINYLMF